MGPSIQYVLGGLATLPPQLQFWLACFLQFLKELLRSKPSYVNVDLNMYSIDIIICNYYMLQIGCQNSMFIGIFE